MSGWIEAFIVIAAIAIVVQMAILVGMFVQLKISMREFTRIANDLQGRVDPILTRVNRILEDSEGRISSVMGDTAEITRLARGQAQKMDRIFSDTLERVRTGRALHRRRAHGPMRCDRAATCCLSSSMVSVWPLISDSSFMSSSQPVSETAQ